MFKTKESKFIVSTILTIIFLLCLIPVIGMINNSLGINRIKNQTIDGDVDVSVSLNVDLWTYQIPITYVYQVVFDFTFNASVTNVEIERINYIIYLNFVEILSGNFVALSFGDNITCQGSVDINYQLNSNPQNTTVNYNLVYTHSVMRKDAHALIILKYAIIIAYIASFLLLPTILFYTVHPDFHGISKEERKKGEEFHNFLAKMKPKERK